MWLSDFYFRGGLNVGAVLILPEGFKLAPKDRISDEIKAKTKGVFIQPYSKEKPNNNQRYIKEKPKTNQQGSKEQSKKGKRKARGDKQRPATSKGGEGTGEGQGNEGARGKRKTGDARVGEAWNG